MIRLLQAIAGAPHGGAELFFLRLALALQRKAEQGRLQQQLLVRPHPETLARLQRVGITPALARFGGSLDLVSRRTFRRTIEAFKPDIVLTYMSRATAACPGQRSGRRFLHVARLGGYYDLKYYRDCDHLIGNTPDIVTYLESQGWPSDRAHYLPNFVEAVAATPAVRDRYDTASDTPLLLAMGRLHRNKAFDVLLEAVAALPRCVLWLAGEGPERPALEALAKRLSIAGRVRFLGWQSDPGPLLAAADLLVVPSRHEPLGNVVIEGWAAGKPVVAAAGQGPSWLIEQGRNGLLVPVDDAPALAIAIRSVLNDRVHAQALAKEGKESYLRRFTEDAVVEQYLALFDRLIGETAPIE